jgi:hypothetical protein
VNHYLPFSSCGSPVAYCQLDSVAGFIYLKFTGRTATPTFSSRLCLFRVLMGACPYPLLRWRVLQAGCSCRLYLLKVCMGDCPSSLLWSTQGAPPSLLHVLFSSLFIQFFSLQQGTDCRGAMLVFPRGGCGATMCRLFTHLLAYFSQVG